MEQFDRGEGIPLDEVEEQLRKKHGFSRSDCSTGRGQPRHNLYIHRSTGQVYNCGAMFAFSHARHWAMKPIEADELEDLMDEAASAGREPEEST
jgi:hypothetical protein